jgi:long-chain fatty acid transport protein
LPSPPVALRLVRTGLLVAALGAVAGAVEAQVPTPSPTPVPSIAEDEKDFLGLTSLALGSGARAFGMGGAFLARADDATAASWNPAGLSYLRRPEFTVVGARNTFVRQPTGVGFTRLVRDSFAGSTLDFGAATYPIEIGPASGSVQLSLQRVFSFHGDRTIERTDQLLTSTGRGGFDVLALGTGFRVVPSLRIGATVNRWVNGYRQDRNRLATRGTTDQNLDFRLVGWNFNGGIIWSPLESLNLGVVGKTTMKGDIILVRSRTDIIPQPPADIIPQPPATTTNAANSTVLQTDDDPTPHRVPVSISIPGAVGAGISWRPWSVLTASVDFTRTFWSKGRIHNFFTLARTEPDQASPRPQVFQALRYPTLDDPVQSDTEQLRVGAEYVVLGRRLKVPLRAGFFTDKQFFFDFRGRAPRFLGYAAGLGVAAGPLLIDVAYLRETGNYLDPEADPEDPAARGAQRSIRFNRVFVSIIYRHGGGS